MLIKDIFVECETPGRVICTVCPNSKLVRAYNTDLKRHLETESHIASKKRNTESVLGFIERLSTNDDLMYSSLIAHIANCNLGISTAVNFITMPLIRAFERRSKIPAASTLYEKVPEVFSNAKSVIKQMISEKYFSLLVDETPMKRFICIIIRKGSPFIAILCSTTDDIFLLNTVRVYADTSVTGEYIAQLLVDSMTEYGLKPENFVSFISDNAPYCNAAYNELIKKLNLKEASTLRYIISL